ncbi:myeloid leukemia factor 1 [Hemitrygon akajei]|uniref:myeloid leukemia factor 1 n=1 Tax=Hemitrygon akajei TaxID=2704970 RepID=UPI003BF9904D
MFREMEEDPFFSDPFHSHQENLSQLMSSFPIQLDQDLLLNFPDDRVPPQTCPRQQSLTDRNKHSVVASSSADPFRSMMEKMRKEMIEMQHNIKNTSQHPKDHSSNTSTVMSYSKVGNEPPKVFQASSHVYYVPGGLKETRRAIKDSESGIEKISIGHHIKDRSHVIQKVRNQKTGDEEVNQEFVNLNEDDAHLFDQEWREKVSDFMPLGAQVYGLQDVKKAMEGQRTKHSKKQPVSKLTPPPASCGCPSTSAAPTGMKASSKYGRK